MASQVLLLGLCDHAEPLPTLFSRLSAPVFASCLTGVILSCWSPDMGLSIHIWHHCLSFLSYLEKKFFPYYKSHKFY